MIVGQRSYGKGSVQNIIDLDGGNSVLKLTVASYYRPSGENIHRFKNAKNTDKWGVSPDPGRGQAYHQRIHPLVHAPGAIATRTRPQGPSQKSRPAFEPRKREGRRRTKAEANKRAKAETKKDDRKGAGKRAIFAASSQRTVRRQAARQGAGSHAGQARTKAQAKAA